MANLESRLQELSETVGTYDRLRQNDQMSMQKLRDRIAQLDLENQSLQNVRRNDSLPGRLLYSRLPKKSNSVRLLIFGLPHFTFNQKCRLFASLEYR